MAGAQAQGVLSSLLQTCKQQARAAVAFVSATPRAFGNRLLPTPIRLGTRQTITPRFRRSHPPTTASRYTSFVGLRVISPACAAARMFATEVNWCGVDPGLKL